ncbi:hypothetical protein [Streptosporangium amethystogenes]|uniref:hypothetical protein n=1 Tax=Streptosporangium amethystogenes TaxID=2002 RepID=UPI00068A4188|nr:hypothetical protein [Streptosporangium amethystogenes]
MGHFVDSGAGGIRSTDALEVKRGVHPAGQQCPEWTADDQRTTLLLLIQGRFRLDLNLSSTPLEHQCDYVGIDHSWQAEEDSVILTVRRPSVPWV